MGNSYNSVVQKEAKRGAIAGNDSWADELQQFINVLTLEGHEVNTNLEDLQTLQHPPQL